jgi:hypothetical protein
VDKSPNQSPFNKALVAVGAEDRQVAPIFRNEEQRTRIFSLNMNEWIGSRGSMGSGMHSFDDSPVCHTKRSLTNLLPDENYVSEISRRKEIARKLSLLSIEA